ncbi:MAG: HAD family hydrolase [Eubacteriales bacterium]|nr:HAD family hydrolase [Eubacteriales bacterium]
MKTLYVSDLDGTLLTSDKCISPKSMEILNRLIGQGLMFSLATARGLASVEYMIKGLDLRLPLIVMNGVFVYDPVKRINVSSNFLPSDIAKDIIDIFLRFGISPWVYTVNSEGVEKVFFRKLENKCQELFLEERLMMGDERYTMVSQYPDLSNLKITHLYSMALKEELDPLYDVLKDLDDSFINYYEDVYQKEYYLIEIMNTMATKKNGLIFLKEYLKTGRVVCFGDNLNDIPMFEAADECYAVSNAHNALIDMAEGVIGSNNEDGVAKFIEQNFYAGLNQT